MSTPTVLVTIRPAAEPQAWVPPDLLRRLEAPAPEGIALGAARVRAAVVEGEEGQVALSRPLARKLGLTLLEQGRRLRARWDGSHLRLGPLVGVFTWARRHNPPFGADTPLIAGMCRLGATEGVLVCAFTRRGVDARRCRVRGHVYDPERARWRLGWLPIPDAVYDRITSRSVAQSAATRRVRRLLARRLRERYFNDRFWDKWQVHRALASSPRWRPLLPETAPYRGAAQLRRWLARYGTVWLKPRQGSQGVGILIARRLGDRGVVVRRARGDGAGRTARTLAELAATVSALKHRGPYVVQEGIALAHSHGRPFDVRILAQKDGTGAWRRTKVFARVAAPGALLSNISAGGTGVRLARALGGAPAGLRHREQALRARIRQIAEELPPELERLLGGPIGEVGIDLAIDAGGRLRFLEANAKPFRLASTRTGSSRLVRLSLLRPILYAAYLAGFPTPAGDGGSERCLNGASGA